MIATYKHASKQNNWQCRALHDNDEDDICGPSTGRGSAATRVFGKAFCSLSCAGVSVSDVVLGRY